jgi:hypothetical protein
MISSREEVEEILKGLGEQLSEPVQFLVIGGAAMLEYGLKDVTEQNRKYVTKEIGKLLSEIWRIKGLAEQEYGPQHPITKKLASMHADAQALLQEKTEKP